METILARSKLTHGWISASSDKRERRLTFQKRHRLATSDLNRITRYQPEAFVLCLEYVSPHR